jgi:hypothetical protein
VNSETEPTEDPEPLSCARCAVELWPGRGNFYRVSIEAVADPTPPTFSAEDLALDVRGQIQRLLAQLASVSEQEALEQVYQRRTLHLCVPCFRCWIEDPTG